MGLGSRGPAAGIRGSGGLLVRSMPRRAWLVAFGEFGADEFGTDHQRLDLLLGQDVTGPGERAAGVDAHALGAITRKHLG